jgi:hypothetical protein
MTEQDTEQDLIAKLTDLGLCLVLCLGDMGNAEWYGALSGEESRILG